MRCPFTLRYMCIYIYISSIWGKKYKESREGMKAGRDISMEHSRLAKSKTAFMMAQEIISAQTGIDSFSMILTLLYFICLPIIHVTYKDGTIFSSVLAKMHFISWHRS